MDLTSEKSKLLARDAEWARLASEGKDIERILSYWTDDAVVIPPGFPEVRGKSALRDYVMGSLQIPGFNITWVSRDVQMSPDGNLAYMFGTNTLKVNGADGEPVVSIGRAVTIWRRDPDGVWRCAVDLWNAIAPS